MTLSSSGASYTFGSRGFSINVGKRGTYMNVCIPGTGFRMRTRIGGYARSKKTSGYTISQPRTYAKPHVMNLRIPKNPVVKWPKVPVVKPEKITTENVLLSYSFDIELLQDGTPVMTIYDKYGAEVHDDHIERLIKRNDRYKQRLLYIEQERKSLTDEKNIQFIEIYKLTERPITKEIVEYKLRELKPSTYTKQEFNTPQPTIEDVNCAIREEITEQMAANKPCLEVVKEMVINEIKAQLKPFPTIESVSSILKDEALTRFPDGLFRKRSVQRDDYIKQNINSRLQREIGSWRHLYDIATISLDEKVQERLKKEIDKWNASLEESIEKTILKDGDNRLKEEIKKWEEYRDNYDTLEAEKEQSENILLYQEYENEKSELENIYYGPEEYVNDSFDDAIGSMELPVEISINYEYNVEKGLMSIDLDLPEIEDMPNELADFDSTGHLVIKAKSKKDLYRDYEQCIYGLAFYLAGLCFNFTTRINYIEISGYTQKTDILSGGTIDSYVYSVLFDRKNFRKLDFMMIDPIRAFNSFPHIVNKESNGELLSIVIDKPLSETHNIEQIDEEPISLVIPDGCIKLEANSENLAISRFMDENDYFDDREYWKKDGIDYFVVKNVEWDKAIIKHNQYLEKEIIASQFVDNNNNGIQFEKEGKIEEAIMLYEDNIKTKIAATLPYDRLMILYHKMSRFSDELRVVKIAVSVFPREEKYSNRLIKILLEHPELSTPIG